MNRKIYTRKGKFITSGSMDILKHKKYMISYHLDDAA